MDSHSQPASRRYDFTRAHARERPSGPTTWSARPDPSGDRIRLRGDEAALFAAHHGQLERAVARSLSVRHCVVEEACSFAWLQLCIRQPDRRRVYPWLLVVARNEAIALARMDERVAPLAARTHEDGEPAPNVVELVPDPIDSESRRDLTERAEFALRALAALPERQRRPMTLKVVGHSYQEIGRELGWSYTQVNRHLTRARKRLAEAA